MYSCQIVTCIRKNKQTNKTLKQNKNKQHPALGSFSSHLHNLIVKNIFNSTVDCSFIINIVRLAFLSPFHCSMITMPVNVVGLVLDKQSTEGLISVFV